MKKLSIVLAVGILSLMTGCYYFGPCIDGTGPVITETREISDFTAVTNTGSFDVIIRHSDEFLVEVEAQGNLMSFIETYVSGQTLIIKTSEGTCIRSSTPVKVHVSLPGLEELESTGSGSIVADIARGEVVECTNTGSGFLSLDSVVSEVLNVSNTGSGTVFINESTTDEIELVQTGSGELDAAVVYGCEEVNIKHSSSGRVRTEVVDGVLVTVVQSGSGNTEISGDAVEADFALTSSGRLDALDLMTTDVKATNTGSGRIFVYATATLDATITGSGDIIYRGNPSISYRITGSGDVRPY
ncbi:MAG: DUF2807 domain-containing protein [Bacteroidetes bacterium]|nr:MAG: DUF2807 domain-containing protein [Bacteroidota bacterium]